MIVNSKPTDLLEQTKGNTCAEELAQVLRRELAEGANNVFLDYLRLGFWLGSVVSDQSRCEVGVVDRIVNGYGDLEACAVVHDRTGDTCPHGLEIETVDVRLERAKVTSRYSP